VTQPNPVYHVYDINAAVGGPIAKDKLWYYMSVRQQGQRRRVKALQRLNRGLMLTCRETPVRVLDRGTLGISELDATDCAFGYRDSRFKRDPDRFVVLAVTFSPSRAVEPNRGSVAKQQKSA